MFLKEIRLENFTSYRGENRVKFSEILNIVVGQNGVGKTNLFNAIGLALTGQPTDNIPMNITGMFNRDYLKECIRDAVTPRWEIEASIDIEGDAYSAICRAMISRGESIYTHRSPMSVQTHAFRERGCLYVQTGEAPLKQGKTRISGWEDSPSDESDNFSSLGVGGVDFVVFDDEYSRFLSKGFRSYLEKLVGVNRGQVMLFLSDLVDADIKGIRANVIHLEWNSCREGSLVLP